MKVALYSTIELLTTGKVLPEKDIDSDPYPIRAVAVAAGQTIAETNYGCVTHAVTSDDELWDSGDSAPDTTYRLTLDKPGACGYHGLHHPYLIGTVIVTS